MGWSGTKRLMWGDEPQDAVNERVDQALGVTPGVCADEYPLSRRKEVFDLLLEGKSLREEVDGIYDENFGRPANSTEYRNLLKVSLDIGSYKTLLL
jgi:hypothetical protein